MSKVAQLRRNWFFKAVRLARDARLFHAWGQPESNPDSAPQEHGEHIIAPGARRLEVPLTDYHLHKVTSHLFFPAKGARLVSVWKPTGKPEFEKEDVLQALFITCDRIPP